MVNYAVSTLNDIPLREVVLYSSTNLDKYIDNDLRYKWVLRDKKLDSDDTTFNEVLDSVIDVIDTDYIIYLSCTSPFIRAATIGDMMGKIIRGEHDSAFIATKHQGFAWYNGESLNYDSSNIPRTQELEPVYLEGSGLYIFSKKMYQESHRRIGFNPYIKTVGIREGWDIDTAEEFAMAERLLKL